MTLQRQMNRNVYRKKYGNKKMKNPWQYMMIKKRELERKKLKLKFVWYGKGVKCYKEQVK